MRTVWERNAATRTRKHLHRGPCFRRECSAWTGGADDCRSQRIPVEVWKARDAVALMKEGVGIQKRALAGTDFSTRVLTDVTGPFYTLVLELTVPNLSTFETIG